MFLPLISSIEGEASCTPISQEICLGDLHEMGVINTSNEIFSRNFNIILPEEVEEVEEEIEEPIEETIEQEIVEQEVEQVEIIEVEEVIEPVVEAPISSYNLSQSEINYLAQLVYSEANGESQQGKEAVVHVVLNRINHNEFPNTVTEVIQQPRQFDNAHAISSYPITESNLAAVTSALYGTDITWGAIFFYNPAIGNSTFFNTRTQTTSIGGHSFFK
jgi:Cell wall hydrolyses involved in spore germination